MHYENRQKSYATRWREENIWLPFRTNSNLWLCHTWRAVHASALFFNARQWGALMDYGQKPQSLQGSPLTFTSWFFFLLYSESAETKRFVYQSFFFFWPSRWSAWQQLNIFVQIPRASCLGCLLTITKEIIQAGGNNQTRFFLIVPALGLIDG